MSTNAQRLPPKIVIIAADDAAVWQQRIVDASRAALPAEVVVYGREDEASIVFETWGEDVPGPGLLLLLVSPALLLFRNVIGDGLSRLIARHRDTPTTLTWVLVADVPWRNTALAEIQTAVPPDRPLAAMTEPEWRATLDILVHRLGELLEVSPEQPAGIQLSDTVVARLSPSSHQALVVANALRVAGGHERLQLEHLVYGLFAKAGGPMHRLLVDVGIDEPTTLVAFMREHGIDIVVPTTIPPLEGSPMLSEASEAAFTAALGLADRQRTEVVHSRQLAFGVLTVEASPIVQALKIRGIRNPEPTLDFGEGSPPTPSASPPVSTTGFASPPSAASPPPPLASPPAQLSPPAQVASPPGPIASPPFAPSPPASSPISPPAPSSPTGGRLSPAASPVRAPASPRSEAVGPWNRAAGFQADTVKGKDQLDIRQEALTLAMVLAHKDVEPPISVGLFGDWGSGKSFFMSEMRKLVARLSEQSRKAGGRFCENVVQLEFNAWHYMDSDLWASLAREIFEGLATAVADREKPEQLDLERERLRVATRSTKDLIAATESQVAEVQRQLDATQQRLRHVEQARASVEDVTRATVNAVLRTPEVESKLRKVASDLRLDEAAESVSDLNDQLDQLSAIACWGRALAVGLGERWQGLMLGLVVVAVGAVAIYGVMSHVAKEIAATMTRVAAVVGGVAAILATVGRGAKAVLARVEEFHQSLEQNLDRQRAQRISEITAQQGALDEERRRLDQQRAQHQQELERLQKLSVELGRLDESRQLVDFIRQRDASSDYRGQLGTVARASQDFKRLNDLMTRAAAARKRQAQGQPTEGDEEDIRLPYIDRIVLYIDDLDRCPESKVVDVLQAVHLLLAYPLFVVVVGVDPRWLLHSLEEHSGAFRTSIEPGVDAQNADWRSTSLNYLEKIFQIPYTLRPMNSGGFKRLVDDLSASKEAPPPASPGSLPPSPSPSPPPVSPPAGMRPASPHSAASPPTRRPGRPTASPLTAGSPTLGSPPSRAGSPLPSPGARSPADAAAEEVLDTNPSALELDARERVFMARLYELIPTPRAAKRFVNVYRLIRASIASAHELRSFLEAREFVAV